MEHSEEERSVTGFHGPSVTLFTAERSHQQVQTSVWKDLFAGGVAGTAGIAIGHPFDTIKVRLQQQQLSSKAKILTSLPAKNLSMYRGLYRGIGAPFATAAIVNASVFCVYGATSRMWENHFSTSATTVHSNSETLTIAKHTVCGMVTGLTTSLVLCPIEYVKIRLQTMQVQPGDASTPRYPSDASSRSSYQLAKDILASRHGVRGLYRGFFATILRQTPSFAAYFPAYYILKEHIGEFYSSSTNNIDNNKDSLWWSSALAGGLAGCLSWMIIYPIDAVKSRIQSLPVDATAKERSFLRISRNISQNEGFARLTFSRGLTVTLLRAFPVNATIFFVYESVNQRLQRIEASSWESKTKITGTNGKHAPVETRLRKDLRRRITLPVD